MAPPARPSDSGNAFHQNRRATQVEDPTTEQPGRKSPAPPTAGEQRHDRTAKDEPRSDADKPYDPEVRTDGRQSVTPPRTHGREPVADDGEPPARRPTDQDGHRPRWVPDGDPKPEGVQASPGRPVAVLNELSNAILREGQPQSQRLTNKHEREIPNSAASRSIRFNCRRESRIPNRTIERLKVATGNRHRS